MLECGERANIGNDREPAISNPKSRAISHEDGTGVIDGPSVSKAKNSTFDLNHVLKACGHRWPYGSDEAPRNAFPARAFSRISSGPVKADHMAIDVQFIM